MKQRLILAFAVFTIVANVLIVSGQITINIPRIPKITRPIVETPPARTIATPADSQSDTAGGVQINEDRPVSKDHEAPALLRYYLDEIKKAQQSVEDYTPEEKSYLVDAIGAEYLLYAISPKAREKYSQEIKITEWRHANPGNSYDTALDALAAAAAKKLPSYKGDLEDFKFRNAVEEKLMRTELTRMADYKIYKTGLAQANWLIDKDDFGLPRARYKSGAFWIRDITDDHAYCTLTYVNIIQDYAGGGTYAASHAQFIEDKLIGCPTLSH